MFSCPEYPIMSYEQQVDDDWYPHTFLNLGEFLLVLDKFPGMCQNSIFRPPWTMTMMYKVLSSTHGVIYVDEASITTTCTLLC
jgi:hypothetical protein